MKNIFIGGVAKSGKSTLAEKICKQNNYNHIPVDYIVASLKRNFKQAMINSNVVIEKENSKKVALLLSDIINIINDKEEKFILDSAHVFPSDVITYLDSSKWDVYFIGYPDITKEEKLSLIRKYDTKNDWTYKYSDDELLDKIDKLIIISKKIKNECKKYNIKFIDSKDIFRNNEEI